MIRERITASNYSRLDSAQVKSRESSLTHLINVLLLSRPTIRIIVASPILHLPLLHYDDIGAYSIQKVLVAPSPNKEQKESNLSQNLLEEATEDSHFRTPPLQVEDGEQTYDV